MSRIKGSNRLLMLPLSFRPLLLGPTARSICAIATIPGHRVNKVTAPRSYLGTRQSNASGIDLFLLAALIIQPRNQHILCLLKTEIPLCLASRAITSIDCIVLIPGGSGCWKCKATRIPLWQTCSFDSPVSCVPVESEIRRCVLDWRTFGNIDETRSSSVRDPSATKFWVKRCCRLSSGMCHCGWRDNCFQRIVGWIWAKRPGS
jgi:hypothetical protein